MTEEAIFSTVLSANKARENKELALAVTALAEFIYTRFHQFNLDCRDEDTRSDYLVWMYPRLSGVIANYNPEKASFRTYLNWVVRLSFRTFIRNRYGLEARQKAYETEEATRLLSIEAEYTNEAEEESLASEDEAGYRKETGSGPEAKLSRKKKEIRSRMIFLLACKAGNYLDDALIARVARATGYGENYVRGKLECILRASDQTRERSRHCLEKRNGYYIRAQKCLYEMKFFERDTSRYASLEKEYHYCQRRWNDLRTGRSSRYKSPSNRFLARALGISRGTIDSTLASAMQDGYPLLS